MPAAGATTPTLLAWENALLAFKKILPAKDLETIQLPVKPEDLIACLKDWRMNQEGRSAKATSAVEYGLVRLQRFSACIDVLAQGLPDPAILLWGSIRFILKIVQDYAEEYDKICEAFARMVTSLPRVEIYTDAFPESTMIQESIHDLYICSLHFWIKACKFYRRKKLFNFLRTTWNNYDTEFSRLQSAMESALDRVEKGGVAQHIKEAKIFRTAQQSSAGQAVSMRESEEIAELLKWLSPATGDGEYYMRDHEYAKRLCHPSTCEWILQADQFVRWSKASVTDAQPNLLLWITGGPGIGKTVLNATIVDHLRRTSTPTHNPNLIYFYFKGISSDNDNPTSAVHSFMYQILAQHKDSRSIREKISVAFKAARGISKPGFDSLWRYFRDLLEMLTTVTIVVDGLDECSDSRKLASMFRDLTKGGRAKIMITSRREKALIKELDMCETFSLSSEHTQKDIQTYVRYKIDRNPRLSNALVVDLVEEKLLRSNNGMFLWVRLVLKELKACLSVERIRETLMRTPTDLDYVYSAVIRRLERTLKRATVEFARMVLAWTMACARPVTFDELSTALSQQYRLEGHTLLCDGSAFPFSERDVEIMCGDLIIIQNSYVLPCHYTVKNYILKLDRVQKTHGDSESLFSLDIADASLNLAKVCLTFFAETSTLSSSKRTVSPWLGKDTPSTNEDSFLDYSCNYWVQHTVNCPSGSANDLARLLCYHFTPSVTRSWLERSFLLDRRGLWRLAIGLEELHSFFVVAREMSDVNEDVSKICRWCASIRSCLNMYGTAFAKFPPLTQTLELDSFYLGSPFSSASELEVIERESHAKIHEMDSPVASDTDFERTHLGYQSPDGGYFSLWKSTLGFLVYDSNQDVLLSGEEYLREPIEWLYIQCGKTGKRLPPIRQEIRVNLSEDGLARPDYTISARMSPDGRYLAIAYNLWFSVWVIDRNLFEPTKSKERLTSQNWATRLIASRYADSTELDFSVKSASVVAFGTDNRLFVPGGFYNLPSREFYPLDSYLSPTSTRLPLVFSGDGTQLFTMRLLESRLQILQYPTTTISNPSPTRELKVQPSMVIHPSHTGKWIICFEPDMEAETSSVIIMECSSTRVFEVCSSKAHFGHQSYHFSKNDEQLVTFLRGPRKYASILSEVTVTVWRLSGEGPQKRSEASVQMAVRSCDSWGLNPPHFAIRGGTSALIVTCNRSIYTAQFNPCVSFPDLKFVDGYKADTRYSIGEEFFEPQPRVKQNPKQKLFLISQDGKRLASLQVGKSKVQLQILSLIGHSTVAGEILLDKVYRIPKVNYSLQDVFVGLNSSFNTLVAGAYAFIIDHDKDDTPIVKFDVDLNINRDSYYWHPSDRDGVSISNCGSIVAFHSALCVWNRHKHKDGQLALFRIDRSNLLATRESIPPPNASADESSCQQFCSAAFHPSLSSITLVFISAEDYSRVEDYTAPVKYIVSSTIRFKKPSGVLKHPVQQFWGLPRKIAKAEDDDDLRRDWTIKNGVLGILEPDCFVQLSASFSTCGTFTCVSCREPKNGITGRVLISRLATPPQPLRFLIDDDIAHVSKSRSYRLLVEKGVVCVEMYQYAIPPDDVEFPFYQKTERAAKLIPVTACPEQWDTNFNHLRCWLLLGDDYNAKMRLVICREGKELIIRYLTVSWNDVLEVLREDS